MDVGDHEPVGRWLRWVEERVAVPDIEDVGDAEVWVLAEVDGRGVDLERVVRVQEPGSNSSDDTHRLYYRRLRPTTGTGSRDAVSHGRSAPIGTLSPRRVLTRRFVSRFRVSARDCCVPTPCPMT